MIRNTTDFINKIEELWPNQFDCSETEYVNARTPVKLICKKHGNFYINPYSGIRKRNICPECNKELSLYKYSYTKEDWIKDFVYVHGDKYDYSLLNDENINSLKIPIICKKHGVFYQHKHDHKIGKGCRKCNATSHHGSRLNIQNNYIPKYKLSGKEKYITKHTKETFIEKAKEKWKDRFDYSEVNYIDRFTPVIIICKKHGKFSVTPKQHLSSGGCKKCAKENRAKSRTISKEQWLEECANMHGFKYDYSLVEYITGNSKVDIICPNHGIFSIKASNHRYGHGCPKCIESSLEAKIRVFCEQNNIKYEYQKMFPWLERYRLDFYFPDYNFAIECQGEQHFTCVSYFDTEEQFKLRQKRDIIKYQKCKENGINIFYFANKKHKNCITSIDNIKKLFNNEKF